MKVTLWFILLIITPFLHAEESWQDLWHKGIEYHYQERFQEAAIEFDSAISLMSDEDLKSYPFVLIGRAENDYVLGNYHRILEDTSKALDSKNLTDYERLVCGLRRIGVFTELDHEDKAVEEYQKYIIDSPILPRYEFSDNKVIIRNLPDCELYRHFTRNFMLSNFCNNPADIHEYGNFWIIDVKSPCNCQEEQKKSPELQAPQRRSPAAVQGCCNTCSRLAVVATTACTAIPGGMHPALIACRVACVYIVEEIRIACEWCCHNGGIGEKCWENFETWRKQVNDKQPNCPAPPHKG